MKADEEHLKLLAIFHYVGGGLTAVFACLPLIHLGMGIVMLISPDFFGDNGKLPPPFLAWMFVALGVIFFLLGEALAICMILAGRFLSHRSNYWFPFVVACVECMFVPVGTVLGVFTILVLARDSVKQLFVGSQASLPPMLPQT